jgi:hypothetical protein
MSNFDQNLCPPKSEQVFIGGIAPKDFYIWDSWSLKSGDHLKLFTLSSPKAFFLDTQVDIQTQRDHLPHHWRLFTSEDHGKTWLDTGPVFAPRLDEPTKFDSRSIWTGSTIRYDDQVIATYTGIRQTDDEHPFIQSIGLAKWDDSKHCFVRLTDEAIICPLRDYDLIKSKGYYLSAKEDLGSVDGEEGGCILAWRDAGMVLDPNGQLHLLWSAKSSLNFKQEAVLGHGILHDPLGNPRFELLPPVFLPESQNFTQAEVPQIVYDARGGSYYLMVSTTDSQPGKSTDADVETRVEMYESSEISTGWRHLGTLIQKSDKRYPGILISAELDQAGGVHVVFTAPFNRVNSAEIIHTIPPLESVVLPSKRLVVGDVGLQLSA